MLALAAAGIAVTACRADEPALPASSCSDYERTPVLFVHGSGLTSGTWDDMRRTLLEGGYPPAYLRAVDMRPRDGDNVRAAERFIAAGAERLLEDSRSAVSASGCGTEAPAKLDIVAHSMGAFSARWYIRFIGGERVRLMIALAGANHGTDRLCGRPGQGDRQMCPAFADAGSPDNVQQRLNGTRAAPQDDTPWGIGEDGADRHRIPPDGQRRIGYVTVRVEADEWIEPAESALLDGAGGIDVGDVSGLPLRRDFTRQLPVSGPGITRRPALPPWAGPFRSAAPRPGTHGGGCGLSPCFDTVSGPFTRLLQCRLCDIVRGPARGVC